MNRSIPEKKKIALVAHDKKKSDLIDWAVHNKYILASHDLVATGTTGKLLEEELDLPVGKLFSGPLGGDQQLGALIAEGKIDMIVFFWDPMETQPHDSDVKALIRLAVAWNIVIACNRTTADFILKSKYMDNEYSANVPDAQGEEKSNLWK